MTRSDIVNEIAKELDHQKKDIDRVILLLLEVISTSLSNKQTIYLRGFGTFGVKTRRPRTIRSVHTGETMLIPTHRVPYFKPGKDLRVIQQHRTQQYPHLVA